MNLGVEIAGVSLKNPVTTGSGTFGSGKEYSEFVDQSSLGAVTTKGVANVPGRAIRHRELLRPTEVCSMR